MEGAAGWLVEGALGVLARGEPCGPDPLALAARTYAATGGDDVGDLVGLALARAMQAAADPEWQPAPTAGRPDAWSEQAAWLTLFVEAAALTDDERLPAVIDGLAVRMAGAWPGQGRVGATLRSAEACLRASTVTGHGDLTARAVDELERLIGLAYRPGAGVTAATGGDRPGALDDHVQAAAALTTAYALTARLPYAMLADDLMQFARRSWWSDPATPAVVTLGDFAARCDAARMLCRLALVHADAGYREAAVITDDYDHLADAGRLLAALEPAARAFGVDGCCYALAAMDIAECRLKMAG